MKQFRNTDIERLLSTIWSKWLETNSQVYFKRYQRTLSLYKRWEDCQIEKYSNITNSKKITNK